MIRRAAFAVLFVAALQPGAAMATSQGVTVMKIWGQTDKCTQHAHDAFPDNTADSLAKRDASLKQCLANGNLPPRDTESVPPAAKP